MPISLRISSNGISYLFKGRVTGDDLISANQRLIALLDSSPERFKSMKYVLIDHSQALSFDYSYDQFRSILDQDRIMIDRFGRKISVAIIAKSDIHYGFARMWQNCTEDWGLGVDVFRDTWTAKEWLRRQENSVLQPKDG